MLLRSRPVHAKSCCWQIEKLQDRLHERGGVGAIQSSASVTADAVAIAAAMKPDFPGMASLLHAASARQARGGEDQSVATTAVQPSISFDALERLQKLGLFTAS